MRVPYETWKKRVDNILYELTGMTSEDLPDMSYRDWYDEGVTPRSAAKRAMRRAWYG